MNEQIYLTILYFFFSAKYATKLYLDKRNIKAIADSTIPEDFTDIISIEDHQKSKAYSIDKLKFSQINIIVEVAMFTVWITLGGFNFLDTIISKQFSSELYRGITFFGVISIIDSLINIPFSLYSRFVIEEKYGFNKMTYKKYFIDLAKQLLLMILLGAPLICSILYIIIHLKNWWFWAFLLLTSFQFFIIWLYPTVIAPIFNKFSPLENESLKEDINNLLTKIGFASSGLFVMDASIRSSHGNAYFTGFGKSKRIVFFDTLIEKLKNSEILAILAHELGHFKKKHIIKMMIRSVLLSLIGFYILGKLYESNTFFEIHFGLKKSSYMAIVLFTTITPIFTFFLTPIFSLLSRKNEYEADEFAAIHTNAEDLISSLKVLYKENSSPIIIDKWYSKFYHSHPPAIERVRFLKEVKSRI